MDIALTPPAPLIKRLSWFDWAYAVIVSVGALFALSRFGEYMDIYEKGILLATIPSLAVAGWFWKPFRPLFLAVGALSLFAMPRSCGCARCSASQRSLIGAGFWRARASR